MGEPSPDAHLLKRLFPTLPRFLWRAFLALGILGVLIAIAAVALNIHGSTLLRDARQDAADMMIPLTWAAFDAKYPVPPEDENAANLYEYAISLAPALKDRTLVWLFDSQNRPENPAAPLSPEYAETAREFVAAGRDALQHLRKASHIKDCRYWLDTGETNIRLPHLAAARQSARLLSIAVLVDAIDGRGSEGLAMARDGLALGRSFSKEPFLISGLVGDAIISMTLSGNLQRLISTCDIPSDELADLQRELERMAAAHSVRPALAGELINYCAITNSLISGEKSIAGVFRDRGAESPPGGMAFLSRFPRRLAAGFWKRDQAIAIDHYAQTLALDGETYAVMESGLAALREDLGQKRFSPATFMFPATYRAQFQAESMRARLRAAAAAIAALRFAKANGRWPLSLNELVPEYLEQAPIDPVAGGPLAYTRIEDGIMVYSVGENGLDDGGKPGLVKPADRRTDASDDTGFRVWGIPPAGSDD